MVKQEFSIVESTLNLELSKTLLFGIESTEN